MIIIPEASDVCCNSYKCATRILIVLLPPTASYGITFLLNWFHLIFDAKNKILIFFPKKGAEDGGRKNSGWKFSKISFDTLMNKWCCFVLLLSKVGLNHYYIILYEKTTCKLQIKFMTDNYLQMCKTFTNIFTLNTNIFTSIKVIKKQKHRHKAIKDNNPNWG